jgi:glutathione S-transferase
VKLYYIPGACSLAPHIALREAGADFRIEKVDQNTKVTESGESYGAINFKGRVPALRLKNGTLITEGAAVLQFIADQAPKSKLAPANGSLERVRLQEHLSFISTELHKAFSPLFAAKPPKGEARQDAEAIINQRFDMVEKMLSDGRPFLLGDTFSVADGYLFVITGWLKPTGIGLGDRPNLRAFVDRVAARPAVQAAMKAEGLVH